MGEYLLNWKKLNTNTRIIIYSAFGKPLRLILDQVDLISLHTSSMNGQSRQSWNPGWALVLAPVMGVVDGWWWWYEYRVLPRYIQIRLTNALHVEVTSLSTLENTTWCGCCLGFYICWLTNLWFQCCCELNRRERNPYLRLPLPPQPSLPSWGQRRLP